MPKKNSRQKSARPKRPGSPRSDGPSTLARKLERCLAERHRVSAGHRIGVAVSGGADSLALLRLLLELRDQLGIVLSVVHFNHQLRGKASDADEKFVARLAARHALPFSVARENIAAKARRDRANLEETARRSRYAFFDSLVAAGKLDRVAVAHTADDQAETVLSHILRGTGIAGLSGIHPEAGVVFRPLLKFRRAELRAYLRACKQPWREDATNRDLTRTRARIRRRLIPLLEKQFQPAAVAHLSQLAELAREDHQCLESAAERQMRIVAKQENGQWRIATRDLLYPQLGMASSARCDEARALGKRIIRLLVKNVKPRSGQLSAIHVDAVLRLAELPDSGKCLHLPGGVEVRREHEFLSFRALPDPSAQAAPAAFTHSLKLSRQPAQLRLVEHSFALQFQVIDWPREGAETNEVGALLDRDKLVQALVVRNWRPGDAMQPLGHRKRHTLSRLLNELGVSRWQKASWPVLTAGGLLAWCRKLPVAKDFAVSESTRTALWITEVPLP